MSLMSPPALFWPLVAATPNCSILPVCLRLLALAKVVYLAASEQGRLPSLLGTALLRFLLGASRVMSTSVLLISRRAAALVRIVILLLILSLCWRHWRDRCPCQPGFSLSQSV